MSEKSESPVAVYGALTANLIIAVSKFIAAYFTRSSAMLSEGIHSVVDTGNEIFLLIGIKKSKRLPDEIHPFGYGKELYFWSFIVAVLIFGIGGGMSFYEGIKHIISPEEMRNPFWNYIVLAVAFISDGISWFIGMKVFFKEKGSEGFFSALKSTKDPTTATVVLEDSADLAGLIIAASGIYLGHVFNNPYFDGAASILIGIVLTAVALFLAFESKELLLGESVKRTDAKVIREIAFKNNSVRKLNKIMTMHIGPDQVLLNMDIEFNPDLSLSEVSSIVESIEKEIKDNFPEITQIFIETGVIKNKKY
jgi:cation diffusion facilitator family transporter